MQSMLLLADFRHSLRGLRRSPALALVAIASLALGIGANVTVFSVVREMILDDVSAARPDRLVRIDGAGVSYTLYRALRAAGAFQNLAFHRGIQDTIWRAGARNEIAWRLTTSANFFDVLGIRPSAGRLYSQADEGRELAVVSNGFWRRRLDGDPAVLGRAIELNAKLYTVVGVLPADYRSIYGHGVSPEVYLSDVENSDPRDRVPGLFGRLRDGASLAEARQAFTAALERLRGTDSAHEPVSLLPMSGLHANAAKAGDDRLFFLFFVMLFGVAGMLALIGSSNVAALMLSRNMSRRRELAIREALGANRAQIVRPLLVEGSVVVACGALLGLALDALLRGQLRYIHWPTAYGLPFEFHFNTDAGLMLYASLAAVLALLVSALLPALRASDIRRSELAFSLRRWDLRSSYVTLQVLLSTLLLLLSTLFGRGLLHLVIAGPGFDVTHTLIAAVHGDRSWDRRQRVAGRVAAIPGVVSVTSAGILPLMGEVPGVLANQRNVYMLGAGENYFATLDVPILRGRDFRITDRGRQPLPVIINRTMAQQSFGVASPIGKHLAIGPDRQQIVEIVGVAADFKMRTLGEKNKPALFMPDFNAQLLVRVAGDPSAWIEPLRRALAEVDRNAALDVRPLADAAAGALFPMRVAAGFLGALSGLGLLLSLVGIYGSVSYAVGRRTREFGIRAAFGASRRRIVWSAVRDSIAVLTCGAALGAGAAILAIRLLADLLPTGVNPWAPLPLLGAMSMLLATGAAAGWIPARRAANIDPSAALRQD